MSLLQVGSNTSLSDSLRVKALSCVAFLIKLKSKVRSGVTPEHGETTSTVDQIYSQ